MATPKRSAFARLARSSDVLFDGIGMRPFGLLVFGASALLFAQLLTISGSSFRTDAVATATLVEQPSRVASFVTHVFVKPGDRVDQGAPIAQLSSHFLDQQIVLLGTEIEAALHLDPRQVDALRTRRQALSEERSSLVILSGSAGVVAEVARLGAAVARGGSVASIAPEFAEEIVAYLPAETSPDRISVGAPVQLVDAETDSCRAAGSITRLGAGVARAPGQLRGLLSLQRHGLPVHISIPDECRLGIGQIVVVDFPGTAG